MAERGLGQAMCKIWLANDVCTSTDINRYCYCSPMLQRVTVEEVKLQSPVSMCQKSLTRVAEKLS